MKWLAMIAVVSCFGSTLAQVGNNEIKNRMELILDGAGVASSTRHSSVEWECVNKALTNKCLVYHNDQWFFFQVSQPGTYYLNLTQQLCSDQNGLQLILLEGHPCETKTYKIKECIPKLSQENIFVTLDSVQAGVTYLINIDGFLGDFCEFTVQLATTPNGFNYIPEKEVLDVTASSKDNLVTLSWTAGLNLLESLKEFAVYRLKDAQAKSMWLQTVPVEKNAHGTYRLDYQAYDTLSGTGTFTYRIYGILSENGQNVLLGATQVMLRESEVVPLTQTEVTVPLDFKRKESGVEIYIYDRDTGRLLKHYYQSLTAKKESSLSVRLAQYILGGTNTFHLRIVGHKNQEVKQFVFRLNNQGILIPQQ